MTTYIVTHRATGQEVYRYIADAPIEWSGMGFDTHDHTGVPDEITDVTPRMESGRRLTKLAFVALIGEDAFKAVLAAAKVNVDIEAFVKLIDWATPEADGTSIDLDDPRTISGLYALEAAGLIPSGPEGLTAAEILA